MQTVSIKQAIEIAKQDPNSAFANQLRRSIESGSLDQAAQKQGVDLSAFGRPTTTASISDIESMAGEQSLLSKVGEATKNLVGGAVYGVSAPGRTVQNILSKGVEKATGVEGFGDAATQQEFEAQTGTDLETKSGKVGEFVGETALFAGAGSAAGAATAGTSMLLRAAAQGGAAATVQALKTGDIGKDELYAGLFGAATVPAGDAVKAMSKNLTTKLPEWLVKPLVKQTKEAKIQGKDIVPYLLETGRVGSVDDLVTKSIDEQAILNNQVDEILAAGKEAGKKVNISQIVDDVVDDINKGGGEITRDEVLETLQSIAYKSKGSLQSENLDIRTANALRSQLDETLYQGKEYLRTALPKNKDILRAFTGKLRSTVQMTEPTTRPLFDKWSKEITLQKALESAATSSGGRNAINFMDLVTGLGTLGATSNPVTALAVAGGRRAFESPQVKTNLAQAFLKTDKVVAALSKASPETRAVLLQFASELLSEDDSQTTSEDNLPQ